MLEVLRYIALNALNTVQKIKAMSKMSKIDKVHIRGVRLCMSKMGKEHTHTFWLITSLILNGFSIQKSFGKLRLRAFQPYHQTLCILKHVEDVEDNLPFGTYPGLALIGATLVVAVGFLPQNFGRCWGPTNHSFVFL